jgi:hypothetical protein
LAAEPVRAAAKTANALEWLGRTERLRRSQPLFGVSRDSMIGTRDLAVAASMAV